MSNLLEKATRPDLHRGLEDVVVDESALSVIDGDEGRLVYRGYDIEDLAREARYEEVLWLLWHGDLPTAAELSDFETEMAAERGVDDAVHDAMAALAAADESPMAALRTGVSMLSATEPEDEAAADDLDATLRKGRRITAKMPTIVAAFDRYRRGEEPVAPDPDLGHAANFLYMLTGEEPDDAFAAAFDMALVLHADHGLNASTFTAMTIASTYADVYSAVTGGIGALSGPWHGGANQDVMETLREMDDSDQAPDEWISDALDEGRRIPGFGHRVYNVKDPRAVLLEEQSRRLAEATGDSRWYDGVRAFEREMDERGMPEQGIAPNVDLYSGSVYDQLGIAVDLYTPVFAMSRVGGWVGHVLEYQSDNRLIRPRARYVGPEDLEWVPLDER